MFFSPQLSDVGTFFAAIPFSFMALFPVLNPLGGAFIILALTTYASENDYLQLCKRVAINTFVLLLVVQIIGTYILKFFGISIPIVQIGGGLVVAYIGWGLLNQSSEPTGGNGEATTNTRPQRNVMNLAFYPLTMPITAGPGCIAVTLTISAHEMNRHSIHTTLFGQGGAVLGILLASLSVYICYRYAEKIKFRLGESGTSVIVRLSAFINFCIGLQIMWHGVSALMGN